MSFDTDPREEQDAEMYAAFAAKDKRIEILESEAVQLRTSWRNAEAQLAAQGEPYLKFVKKANDTQVWIQFGDAATLCLNNIVDERGAMTKRLMIGEMEKFLAAPPAPSGIAARDMTTITTEQALKLCRDALTEISTLRWGHYGPAAATSIADNALKSTTQDKVAP